ncbi:hypothetical protein QBC34DRAFT_449022 [Podospora aff. communis PSN243]|uniref:HD domain-containing protein n=1 Tax=Podospora aff. communis PSN243 TaxID=3040156 RepID=A0AAV9GNQ4_9PEZI|nr:hypothetical protein QBC34DRAFT_449022 [Podospora aff. communis PSN243]
MHIPLLLLSFLTPTLTTASLSASPSPSPLPYRTIANITLPATPLIFAAESYVLHHAPSFYNHSMRTWLYGALHLRHNPALASLVDPEVLALALILHDIASPHNLSHPLVTPHNRFEVDSANAAASFIRSHPDGKDWPDWRVQRVWDGIALHAEPKLALHKEADVFAIFWGNELDFSWGREGGEKKGITEEEYRAVERAFPRGEGGSSGMGLLGFVAWYCRYKPESTYVCSDSETDTWMQAYGEMLVPGYSAVGHRLLDGALAAAGVNVSAVGV